MLHDIIKIKYIREGYLPNFPYHLISDREMFEAFTKDDGYFLYNYSCPDPELYDEWEALKNYIYDRVSKYQSGDIDKLDNWIYCYMLGEVISVNSPEVDILMLYDMFKMKVEDNTGIDFNAEVASDCYAVSDTWIRKLGEYRPACMFGEPHVIKSMRLNAVALA